MGSDSYLRLAGQAIRVSRKVANAVVRDVATVGARSSVQPSRKARRFGILAPGDGPPGGSLGSFLDYREILLPAHLKALHQGIFPLGRAKHPHDSQGDYPIFLDWAEVSRHVAVVGPAGAGKTWSILAPWTVCASLSGITAIAVDVKGDLLDELIAAKSRVATPRQTVTAMTWDVGVPQRSRSWNPLHEVTDATSAAQLAIAVLGKVDPADHQKFFAERDLRWLRGIVLLAAGAFPPHVAHPRELYRLVVDQDELARYAAAAPRLALELVDLLGFPRDEFSRATSGLSNRLSWLADPSLADMLAGVGPRGIDCDGILASGDVMVVGMRRSGGQPALVAGSIMLNMLKLRRMNAFGTSPQPVFWVLDEVARYASRIELDDMLDMLRGANSPVCIGLQDTGQLGTELDQVRMLTNCDTFITMKGVSASTASYFSERLGPVSTASMSQSLDSDGRWRPSVAHSTQPRLGTAEIMYPPVGSRGSVVQIRAASSAAFLVTFD